MKILFETVNGKEVLKEFENGTLAKNFIVKNKDKLSKAKIMEGPLGSGGWTPKKAYNNFKKGRDRLNNLRNMDDIKDSYDQNIHKYLANIAYDAAQELGFKLECGVSRDEHGYFIFCWTNGYRTMKDEENADKSRKVPFTSKKYKNNIYMPKLTKYIEEHKSLPSIKQVKEYMKKLIEKRYENNLNDMKKKKPSSLTAMNDVEDF